MKLEQATDLYLYPTYFIDHDHALIKEKAETITAGMSTATEKAVALYYWVRDAIYYYPYNISLKHSAMKASNILQRPKLKGFCIEKSVVLAALCRAVEIPSRLVFFNVRNHIGVEQLLQILRTDVIVFHGCNELFLDGQWVKCTPAFNKSLCDHLGVATLEFDGKSDSVFQEYDKAGNHFMDYVHQYGCFHDVPHDMFIREMQRYYPHFFEDPRFSSFMQKAMA